MSSIDLLLENTSVDLQDGSALGRERGKTVGNSGSK